MKKAILLVMLIAGLLMLPRVAMAVVFSMDQTQLLALYETYESPSSTGTYLSSVSAVPGGAKYVGNTNPGTDESPGSGWSEIWIGANLLGQPWGGSAGDEPTIGALGMGSMVGYDSYALSITNKNENDWMFNLYTNAGYAGEDDYYAQNTWTAIPAGSTKIVTLDFTNANVWKNGTPQGWMDLTALPKSELDPDHMTNIGFQIGADVPLGAGLDDWTYEAIIKPVPEPTSMLLLGLGLIGLAGRRIRKRFKA